MSQKDPAFSALNTKLSVELTTILKRYVHSIPIESHIPWGFRKIAKRIRTQSEPIYLSATTIAPWFESFLLLGNLILLNACSRSPEYIMILLSNLIFTLLHHAGVYKVIKRSHMIDDEKFYFNLHTFIDFPAFFTWKGFTTRCMEWSKIYILSLVINLPLYIGWYLVKFKASSLYYVLYENSLIDLSLIAIIFFTLFISAKIHQYYNHRYLRYTNSFFRNQGFPVLSSVNPKSPILKIWYHFMVTKK